MAMPWGSQTWSKKEKKYSFCIYKDTYLPVTFKGTQEVILVTFHLYDALTKSQNITINRVTFKLKKA